MNRKKLALILKEGSISFPKLLFREYRRLGLTDLQFLLVLHLHVFAQEGKPFPTIQEIEKRMELPSSQIIMLFQQLMKGGFLAIDQDYDEWGKLVERYNLFPLYEKLAEKAVLESKAAPEPEQHQNLFAVFEREFGRPLSPMEYEHINQWLDQDGYSETLILAALREAVISGILNIRYIDRILLEWSKNNIRTEEEARQYSLRFREKQFERLEARKKGHTFGKEAAVRFPQYNWLEKLK